MAQVERSESMIDYLSETPVIKCILSSYAQDLLQAIATDYKLDLTELSEYYKIKMPDDESGTTVCPDGTSADTSSIATVTYMDLSAKVPIPIFRHTHLPVRWIVEGCEFCAKNGNVLCPDKQQE